MSEKIQAPRGTFDVLGDDALARDRLEDVARRILEPAGYERIETPMFECTALFARGVGESTDVVQKEMYTFDAGDSESLTLRPEGTAPVCRAYLEHVMHKLPQPVKLCSSPLSKVYISFCTTSVDSPTPRANSSVASKTGVSIRR